MMKICITSQGSTLDTLIEERFGRAPYFMIIDTETGSAEAIENRFAEATGGVGPKAAQLLIAHDVKALISGMVGGNAREVLVAAGIRMYTYRAGGTVKDALDQFTGNKLERSG
jgi:predicted Fe-Mo cluster-binding NifX family protein